MPPTNSPKPFDQPAVDANPPPSTLPKPEHVNISPDQFPTAEPPLNPQEHSDKLGVFPVVAVPESGLVATAGDDGMRIYALGGDGELLHFCEQAFGDGDYSGALAALGGDVLACAGYGGKLTTWKASTGERLSDIRVGAEDELVLAIAAVGDTRLAVGTNSGALFFFSHSGGSNLCGIAQGKKLHTDAMHDIYVRGDVVVTASWDKRAVVWSAETREPLAVHAHDYPVWRVAACERFVATGSRGGCIRVFSNGAGYPLVKVLKRVHSSAANNDNQLIFITEDLLLSVSGAERTLAFLCLSSGKVVARVDVGFNIWSTVIMPSGQIACCGHTLHGSKGRAVLFSPPASVADGVKQHATSLLASTNAGDLTASEDADIGPTLPPAAKKQRVGDSDDGISFNLDELKAAALNRNALVAMSVDELSRVVSVAMVATSHDAQEASRLLLPKLSKCLAIVFTGSNIYGDMIVGFPEAGLHEMITDALRKDENYVGLGENAVTAFEWRLRRFLKSLRP